MKPAGPPSTRSRRGPDDDEAGPRSVDEAAPLARHAGASTTTALLAAGELKSSNLVDGPTMTSGSPNATSSDEEGSTATAATRQSPPPPPVSIHDWLRGVSPCDPPYHNNNTQRLAAAPPANNNAGGGGGDSSSISDELINMPGPPQTSTVGMFNGTQRSRPTTTPITTTNHAGRARNSSSPSDEMNWPAPPRGVQSGPNGVGRGRGAAATTASSAVPGPSASSLRAAAPSARAAPRPLFRRPQRRR